MHTHSERNRQPEQLLDAIGALPEDMIAAAAPTGKASRARLWRRLGTAAACFVCVAAVTLGAWRAGLFDGHPGEIERGNNEETIRIPEGEIAYIPSWENRPLAEQYTDLTYDGRHYSSQWCTTDPELLGEVLGEITVRGYDEIKDETHEVTATLYRLAGVTEQFALAVVHPTDGTEDALPVVFIDSSWRPATLGELIDGLALESLMSFGTVYSGDNRTMYEDVPDRVIWDLMLSQRDVVNVYDEAALATHPYGQKLMGASVYISALGYRNISLAVTDAGYLTTNIGSTGKAFYIGEERAAEIATYIETHYEGEAYKSVQHEAVEEPEPGTWEPSGGGASTPSYNPRG